MLEDTPPRQATQPSEPDRSIQGELWPPALIVALTWLSDFLRLAEFGLYEDDFTIIPQAVAMSWSEVLSFVGDYIFNLYGHGRPISNSLIYLFSHLGDRLGGLTATYWIGFLWVALNAVLFYTLLRRLQDRSFALLGGLIFALYPADTTQPFLTHSLGLHPSLALLLLASHAYLSQGPWLTYPLALLILFTYETPYPVLLALPLLQGGWGDSKVREILRHTLIVGALLGLVFLLRAQVGEGRVAGLTFPSLVLTPLRHMIVGPIVALAMFIYRAYTGLTEINLVSGGAALGAAAGFWGILRRFSGPVRSGAAQAGFLRETMRGSWKQLPSRVALWFQSLAPEIRKTARLALAGGLSLILAYPLTFTIRSFSMSGRATRIHFAAIFGASLLVTSLTWLVLRHSRPKSVIRAVVALWLAALLSFAWDVQQDYVQSWDNQQEFWRQVVELVPDVEQGTVVLVEPEGLRDTVQIDANTWNLPRILPRLYQFPDDWDEPPRVYRLVSNWQAHIVEEGGVFRLFNLTVTAPSDAYKSTRVSEVVFLDAENGQLRRADGQLEFSGYSFELKSGREPRLDDFETTYLYDLLIAPAAVSDG